MDVIERFITDYEREYDYWEAVARTARTVVETELGNSGLRAIVTSRAKSVDRLREKLTQRDRDHRYTSTHEIRGDIKDLAGVRVALYFPGQMDEVEQIIRVALDVRAAKQFPAPRDVGLGATVDLPPHPKRFSGYGARHFQVHLPGDVLSDASARYAAAPIEIQVASVLMHAWSEVEHDLVYKPLEGQLSQSEYALLDQVNGLVLAGEIALEQLQKAADERVSEASSPFRDHYELAEFLRTRLGHVLPDTMLGRIDILFGFLEDLGVATAKDIQPTLDILEEDVERRPITEKLADLLLADDPRRLSAYRNAISKATSKARHPSRKAVEHPTEPGAASLQDFIDFLTAWTDFEDALSARLGDGARRPLAVNLKKAEARGVLTLEQVMMLQKIRELRNDVVHRPSRSFTQEAADKWTPRLREMTEQLRDTPAGS